MRAQTTIRPSFRRKSGSRSSEIRIVTKEHLHSLLREVSTPDVVPFDPALDHLLFPRFQAVCVNKEGRLIVADPAATLHFALVAVEAHTTKPTELERGGQAHTGHRSFFAARAGATQVFSAAIEFFEHIALLLTKVILPVDTIFIKPSHVVRSFEKQPLKGSPFVSAKSYLIVHHLFCLPVG